ncbi:MAG: PEP-CTERM sorting domain-containing protein [Microcystaceae cyanobacterium]
MIWKINPLLISAATVLTLIAPNVQAQVVTETLLTNTTGPSNPGPPFILDTGGLGLAAIHGVDLSVGTTNYDFCFEFGGFDDVYAEGRTDICNGFISAPEFDSNSLPSEAFADEIATDLLTALNDNQDIIRALGESVLDSSFSFGMNRISVPFNRPVEGDVGLSLSYSGTDAIWDELSRGDNLASGGNLFVRFQATSTPPEPVPEPSGLLGIFLAGVSLNLMGRRSKFF